MSQNPLMKRIRRVGGLVWTVYRRANKELVRHLGHTLFKCHGENVRIERIGSDYGGWYVPVDVMDSDWVCFCIGVGQDVTFDTGIVDRFDCRVYAMDPTPAAIRHMDRITYNEDRLTFMPVGLWTSDVTLKFFAPADPDAPSHSVFDLHGTGSHFDAPCKRLSSLMKETGESRLDLLKIDIEGAWWDVIRRLPQEGVPLGVLCAEFDSPTSLYRVWRTIRLLRGMGLELVHFEKENFLFMHRDWIEKASNGVAEPAPAAESERKAG